MCSPTQWKFTAIHDNVTSTRNHAWNELVVSAVLCWFHSVGSMSFCDKEIGSSLFPAVHDPPHICSYYFLCTTHCQLTWVRYLPGLFLVESLFLDLELTFHTHPSQGRLPLHPQSKICLNYFYQLVVNRPRNYDCTHRTASPVAFVITKQSVMQLT